MPDTRNPATAEPINGLLASLLSFFGSLLRHVSAFAGLARVEAKEAAETYVRVVAYLILALIFAVFGYIFFIIFLAFLLGVVFGVSWLWIILGLVVLHLCLAFWCAVLARDGFRSPVFTETAAQLRKEIESLGSLSPGARTNPPSPK